MGAVRAAGGRSAVLQLHPTSSMAPDGGCRRPHARLDTCARGARREGAGGRSPVRVGAGRHVAPGATRWGARGGAAGRGHGHARSLDSAGVERKDGRLEPTDPALCINRSGRGRPGGLPGAQRASFGARRPFFEAASDASRTGSHLTTDRLVTPFHASRAQSGPRKVSPMNFTGGSRSIQRLLAARPLLTCWSRGRA